MSAPVLRGSRCQCAACGEFFSRPRAFDRHRVGSYAKQGEWRGDRRCLTPAEMMAKGWTRNPAGIWVTGALDGAGRARARARSGGGATPVAPVPRVEGQAPLPALAKVVP